MTDTIDNRHSTRIRVDLSHDWAFVKRNPGRRWLREGSEPGDEVVDLPHSWNSRDSFQAGVNCYRGYGSYRKVFQMPGDIPREDYLWFIRSEGFYGTGDVWLNGRKLSSVDGQYLGFCLPAERYIPFDAPSILGIRLTNRCRSHVLPGIADPDFLLYGGMAGRVWVEGVPKLHVNRDETRIITPIVSGKDVEVVIRFVVANGWNRDRNCSVVWTIEDSPASAEASTSAQGATADQTAGKQGRPFDVAPASAEPTAGKQGRPVAASDAMPMNLGRQGDSGLATVRLRLLAPHLWSPDSPELYRARCRITADGAVVDDVTERFGIRKAEFRPRQGFFLNGERLELRGCNRHECMPGFGNALPVNLHREDAVTIRKIGLNFVRLSHYPQHPAFLDACDELGLLVYAEIASWKSVRTGRWLRSACRQMRDMIVRDRNRPSVILWGMGNESRSRRAYLTLREQVREWDPTRPVIYAENHFHRAVREKTVGIPDVWGVNYELDSIDAGCEASVQKNVVVSECSNYPPATRGALDKELEQVALIEGDLQKLAGRPGVAGFALWCFNDYATLRKERYTRHCGIVDAWRVPKPAAAFLRAKYATAPFVKVFGDWGHSGGPETGTRELHIMTNCDEVALLVNGRPVASVTGGPHRVQTVPFEPGKLTAIGARNGVETKYEMASFSAAARVDLKPEKADGDAEQRETVSILVRITDDDGHVVTPWSGKVRVTVEGAGSARTYREDNAVDVAGGIGRFFITGNGQIGAATLKAACETLVLATTKVNFH